MTRRTLLLGTSIALGSRVLFSGRASAQSQRGSTALFVFQNSFWINLHLFVRRESRAWSRAARRELSDSVLSRGERFGWEMALDAYQELGRASLIFDERLIRISNALATLGNATEVRSGEVESGLASALNRAAPVYRSYVWPRHRRENERWITSCGPAIRRHADSVTKALATVFPVRWSTDPLLVDLSRYTGPNLAFTTQGPDGTAGHAVIAPQKNSDEVVALDTIFHELSHTVDDQIVRMVDAEAEKHGVQAPPSLWHAITLYTTGEVVRREVGRQGDPAYRPDATRAKTFVANGWQQILLALEKHWKPYLEGRSARSDALRDLVLAVSV